MGPHIPEGDSMNIIQTLKQKLSAGSVLIQPGDPLLRRISRIDPKLLLSTLKTVKNANEIEIAYYPHQEGGNAILSRDACSRDDMQWTAVCPLVREDV